MTYVPERHRDYSIPVRHIIVEIDSLVETVVSCSLRAEKPGLRLEGHSGLIVCI